MINFFVWKLHISNLLTVLLYYKIVHETWYIQPVYKDLIPSITRLVTHLAAPGFAFIMGFSIILFLKLRLRIGWKSNELLYHLYHYVIRGLSLILLDVYFATFGFFLSLPVLTVLFALGVNFIIGGIIFLAGIKSFPYLIKFYQKTNYEIVEKKANYMRNIIFLIITILLAVENVLQTPKSSDYDVVSFS